MLPVQPCPCDSGARYVECCGPLHQGRPAETAEELMRSRYSAYAVGDLDHLVRTWHPRTRPHDLRLDAGITWTGLEVLDSGVDHVEFVACFTRASVSGRVHERSRFEQRRGRWVYVDGVLD